MTALKNLIEQKPAHVLKAEQMADAIYAEPTSVQIEMVSTIKRRLIKHSEMMLQKLRN